MCLIVRPYYGGILMVCPRRLFGLLLQKRSRDQDDCRIFGSFVFRARSLGRRATRNLFYPQRSDKHNLTVRKRISLYDRWGEKIRSLAILFFTRRCAFAPSLHLLVQRSSSQASKERGGGARERNSAVRCLRLERSVAVDCKNCFERYVDSISKSAERSGFSFGAATALLLAACCFALDLGSAAID